MLRTTIALVVSYMLARSIGLITIELPPFQIQQANDIHTSFLFSNVCSILDRMTSADAMAYLPRAPALQSYLTSTESRLDDSAFSDRVDADSASSSHHPPAGNSPDEYATPDISETLVRACTEQPLLVSSSQVFPCHNSRNTMHVTERPGEPQPEPAALIRNWSELAKVPDP